jgi:DNA-binding CsgD family transcriptional regulator
MDDIIHVVLDKMPLGVIVFGRNMEVLYSNRRAKHFLKWFELPHEIITIGMRIFDAINTSRLKELFPGEVYISKNIEGSSSNWIFKFFIHEGSKPFICIFIFEEAISHKLEMNKVRKQFGLTRRETDVLRRVLDGLKNIEIAEDLEISEQTVKDHLSNVYMKTGVENRFALIRSLISTFE